MDPIISTPRLRLTLLTNGERGSQDLKWYHELRSDEQATWWSLGGKSKSIEESEKKIKKLLPNSSCEGEEKTYQIAYAVHKVLDNDPIKDESQPIIPGNGSTEFIGIISLKSLNPHDLILPSHLTTPTSSKNPTLTIELAYSFLPKAWNKGFATESLKALFQSIRKGKSFWIPFSKVYVRGIVNEENTASQRVIEKIGMRKRGVYVWRGEAVWLAGRWQVESRIFVYGMDLLE